MIHQPSIERLLREAIARQPNIKLHTGWQLVALSEDAGTPLAEFATERGSRRIAARFLVGADGARSTTRELSGIGIDDLGFDETWLIVDTIVHDASRLPPVNLQICDPARPTTCVLMGEGRHRWEFMLKPGEAPEDLLGDAMIDHLLSPWNVAGAISIERKAVYRFAARVAERWQKGNILLAGDAAHQMPPFAGQGLCSGVRDAANLAWKLAAVIEGDAGEHILESYQPEREPNVRAIIGLAVMMGRTVCITDPAAAAARDAQMLAARAGESGAGAPPPYPDIATGLIARETSGAGSYFPQPVAGQSHLDDQLGPGPWIIGKAMPPSIDGIPAASIGANVLGPFAGALEHWLNHHDAEAVLVRPDRYVFGTGAPDDLVKSYRASLLPTPAFQPG